MKQEQIFMMIFRYTPDVDHVPDEQELTSMKQAWGSYIGQLAIAEKLVNTYQLGFESQSIATDLSITDGLVCPDGQTVGGTMVVKAHSLDAAVAMGKNSPILKMGGTVEVRSIIPMESQL